MFTCTCTEPPWHITACRHPLGISKPMYTDKRNKHTMNVEIDNTDFVRKSLLGVCREFQCSFVFLENAWKLKNQHPPPIYFVSESVISFDMSCNFVIVDCLSKSTPTVSVGLWPFKAVHIHTHTCMRMYNHMYIYVYINIYIYISEMYTCIYEICIYIYWCCCKLRNIHRQPKATTLQGSSGVRFEVQNCHHHRCQTS